MPCTRGRAVFDLSLAPTGGVIGVDPGASGGIGYVHKDYAQAWKLDGLTLADTWDLVTELWNLSEFAVLEKVNGRPPPGRKAGASGMFKFGQSYGQLEALIVAAKIRYSLVTPQKWQGALSCKTGGDKNVTKAKAQQLWPHLKITHAIADALLIAEYGRTK